MDDQKFNLHESNIASSFQLSPCTDSFCSVSNIRTSCESRFSIQLLRNLNFCLQTGSLATNIIVFSTCHLVIFANHAIFSFPTCSKQYVFRSHLIDYPYLLVLLKSLLTLAMIAPLSSLCCLMEALFNILPRNQPPCMCMHKSQMFLAVQNHHNSYSLF